MRAKWSAALAALAILGMAPFAGPALAAEKTFHFGLSDQRTNITFESSTDFEQILGMTNNMSGRIVADLEAGTGSVKVSVAVASMKTGIELRDEHMRSAGWLDAEKFADISFTSDNVTKEDDGGWLAPGTFAMHGVSQELIVTVHVKEIPVELAERAGLESGEWLKISTSFEVKLSDFGVDIPGMAAAKVNDTWKVTIQAFAGTGK
jgi:polyisoprenoid-binding protein YceI